MSPQPELTLEEMRRIARRMAGRRRNLSAAEKEDAAQEAWLAGWRVQGKSHNYVVRVMSNAINGFQRGRVPGSNKSRATGPVLVKSVVSRDSLGFEPSEGSFDTYPSDNDWVDSVLRDEVDLAIVVGVMSGMTRGDISRTWGLKRWTSYLLPQLEQAWKETVNA